MQPTSWRRACVVAVATSVCVFTVAPATADPAPEVVNIAHRGASSTAPENTLPAISQAVAARADFVEMDIRLTEDGVPVILHDQSLRRTTDVEEVFPGRSPWAVDDFTLTEVRHLDAGGWRSVDYRGAAVPTLDDALGELAGSPAGVVLEVKDPEMYGGVTGIGSKIMSVVMSHPRWAGAVRRSSASSLCRASNGRSFGTFRLRTRTCGCPCWAR